jgi:hypothetical protein
LGRIGRVCELAIGRKGVEGRRGGSGDECGCEFGLHVADSWLSDACRRCIVNPVSSDRVRRSSNVQGFGGQRARDGRERRKQPVRRAKSAIQHSHWCPQRNLVAPLALCTFVSGDDHGFNALSTFSTRSHLPGDPQTFRRKPSLRTWTMPSLSWAGCTRRGTTSNWMATLCGELELSGRECETTYVKYSP